METYAANRVVPSLVHVLPFVNFEHRQHLGLHAFNQQTQHLVFRLTTTESTAGVVLLHSLLHKPRCCVHHGEFIVLHKQQGRVNMLNIWLDGIAVRQSRRRHVGVLKDAVYDRTGRRFNARVLLGSAGRVSRQRLATFSRCQEWQRERADARSQEVLVVHHVSTGAASRCLRIR